MEPDTRQHAALAAASCLLNSRDFGPALDLLCPALWNTSSRSAAAGFVHKQGTTLSSASLSNAHSAMHLSARRARSAAACSATQTPRIQKALEHASGAEISALLTNTAI